MHSQRLFKILTFVTLAVTAGAITERVLSKPDEPSRPDEAFVWDEYLGGDIGALAGTSFVTGIDQTVPDLATIPRLTSIPWDGVEVAELFNRAGSFSACEVLPADINVEQPLAVLSEDTPGPLGRLSMFSIGLQMDPLAEESLPSVTDGAIKSYLQDHLLTVQAPLYRYPDGSIFFGSKLKAAFYAGATPQKTLTPEPMVASAIGRFRTLGVYAPSSKLDENIILTGTAEESTESEADAQSGESNDESHELRTLILGFKYAVDPSFIDPNSAEGRRPEFELLFLHLLPDHTVEHPSVAVFATSNGRTILHELELSRASSGAGKQASSPAAEITADIRFEEFTMMGLYPTKPVVTGVTHRARQSLPTEIVRGLMLGLTHGHPESLTSILDQLHAKADSE